jgi:hypothetical protein
MHHGCDTNLDSSLHFFSLFLSFFAANRTCPKTDPRFHQLVSRVTQNFDTFEDYGTNLDQKGKTRVVRNQLDQFYDYNYRRVRKPKLPGTVEELNGM